MDPASGIPTLLWALAHLTTAGLATASLVGWRMALVGRAFEALFYRSVLERLNGGPLEEARAPLGAAVFRDPLYRLTGVLLVLTALGAGLAAYRTLEVAGRLRGRFAPGSPAPGVVYLLLVATCYTILNRVAPRQPGLAVPAAVLAGLYLLGLASGLEAIIALALRGN